MRLGARAVNFKFIFPAKTPTKRAVKRPPKPRARHVKTCGTKLFTKSPSRNQGKCNPPKGRRVLASHWAVRDMTPEKHKNARIRIEAENSAYQNNLSGGSRARPADRGAAVRPHSQTRDNFSSCDCCQRSKRLQVWHRWKLCGHVRSRPRARVLRRPRQGRFTAVPQAI